MSGQRRATLRTKEDKEFDQPHFGHASEKQQWPRMEELRRKLRIDKDDLDSAAIEQPQLFFEVAEETALAISRRDAANLALEQLEAVLSQKVRSELAETEEKVTEAMIRQEVQSDPALRRAQQHYSNCKAYADLLGAFRESYAQRLSALKIISDLWKAGYYSQVSGRGMRSEAEGRVNLHNRERLAAARQTEEE